MPVTHPLYHQISGNNAAHKKWKIQCTGECQEALNTLQGLWTSAPILAFADFTKPFKLQTNASTVELGAILYQEQDGKDKVSATGRSCVCKCESHYPAHNLEFLALKWAVTESFQEYLYGNTFASSSDKNPLTYILKTAKLDATGDRRTAIAH